jgi:hypothetical protein
MATTRVASTQIDLLDLNDAIISGTEPPNPVDGTLWIDNRTNPPILKVWHPDTGWVTQPIDLTYLDPGASQTITDNNQLLVDMADDLVLTNLERLDVKNIVTNIIGSIPTDTGSMPSLSSIDSTSTTFKGEVWSLRKSALNAGIATTDVAYTTYGSAYTTLVNYLNGLAPKPWNISSTVNNTLTSLWRTNWNSYYTAYNALVQAMNTKLGTSPIGGRNYLRNTGAFTSDKDLNNWSLNVGSACAATMHVVNDGVYGNVLNFTVTTNAATGNNWIVFQNTGLTLPNGLFTIGNIYTLSFYIKNPMAMSVNFKDADSTDPVVSSDYAIPVSASWQKIVWTFTATATGATPELYLSVTDHVAVGDIYLTYIMLEDGTRPTGWNPAPEDSGTGLLTLTGRVSKVEDSVKADSIVLAVTTSTTYKNDLLSKAPSDVADGLAASQDVKDALASAIAYTDGQVQGLQMTTYVKHADMTVYEQDITSHFKTAGGINMLKNSIGLSGSDFWTVTGAFNTTQTPDLQPYGLKSGFSLDGCTLKQVVAVTPGITYTLSARVFKDTTGTGYLTFYDTSKVTGSASNIVNFISGSKYSLADKQSISITPTTGSVTVEISADSANTTGMIFSGVQMNIGDIPFEWTNHPDEVYIGNINFDINGISVQQIDSATNKIISYTVMTPDRFAGYADADGNGTIDQTKGSKDEVFRMDKDSFVMKSATLNPIKIIPITTGGHNGIAFVGV